MDHVRLVDGDHSLYELGHDLKVHLPIDKESICDVVFQGLTRTVFCLDHQVQRYIILLIPN
jgi:hypothetical protein